MSILYPVAPDAETALKAPVGHAARALEAEAAAGEAVDFVTEAVGPVFDSKDALQDAYSGVLSQPFVQARPITPAARAGSPVRPTFEAGRRWPQARAMPEPQWRLSISYWRPATATATADPQEAARQLRRKSDADALSGRDLQALARQPLRPIKPQKALDIGLFEVRPPEAPHILMPDE